jgi:hypothetical protein
MFSVITDAAFGLRGQRHELRLHVGGEAGEFFRGHVGGSERIVAHDADGIGVDLVLTPTPSVCQAGAEVSGIASGDVEVAAGHGAGDEEGAGFNAVRDDAVLRAF